SVLGRDGDCSSQPPVLALDGFAPQVAFCLHALSCWQVVLPGFAHAPLSQVTQAMGGIAHVLQNINSRLPAASAEVRYDPTQKGHNLISIPHNPAVNILPALGRATHLGRYAQAG